MTIEITDTLEGKAQENINPDSGEPLGPLEGELLSQLILELNIARKNFAIYPLGHSQIATSIQKAYGLLARLMSSRAELIIGAAKDCIVTDDNTLDFKNPVHREFSNALHSLNIAAISFVNGLTREELSDFFKVIATGLEDRERRHDLVTAMNESGITHIRIESIDYERFYLTEETEIVAFESPNERKTTDIWHEFIGNLFAEQTFDKSHRDRFVRMRPSEFAAEINDQIIDPVIALQNFQKIFTESSLSMIQHHLDLRLDTLLKTLQPELRRQFLSITFDAISNRSDEVIANYSNDMILEMLNHANSQNKQLSPSLINLIEKLSHTQGSMPLNAGKMDISDADSALVKESVQKLLDRESYEKYVDTSYGAMLQRLSKEAFQSGQFLKQPSSQAIQVETDQPIKTVDGLSFFEPYQDVFDAKFLDLRITHMSLGLLNQDLAIEDYTGFAEKLTTRAGHLVDIGAYDVLLMMIQAFQRHAREKSADFRLVAEECLQKLAISDITTRVLEVLQHGSTDHANAVSDILSAIGKPAIPGIMDIYIAEAAPIGSRPVFELLKGLGTDSLEEAYRRLHDSRIAVLRKMLAFIRKTGSVASIAHILPLICHEHSQVRLEALTALLHFQDSDAAAFLRCSLQSSDDRECAGAIQLSGYYRVGEVTQDLTELLIKSPWRKVDYQKNAIIIKSLGKIGDPGVLPVLEKLCEKSLAIYPDDLRKMKIAVFESLDGYPREKLSRILNIGTRSDDYRIRNICKAFV